MVFIARADYRFPGEFFWHVVDVSSVLDYVLEE
jgi:hypothetical protein